MNQQIKNIPLKELILWSENPRDPISPSSNNESIISRALANTKKWELQKLADSMGSFYDFSELPTIVYHEGRPVVYDGNRRVALGLLARKIVNINHEIKNIPSYEENIPCNVCTKEIALQSIWRKHANSGSWDPLERDIFQYKHLNKEKSPFIILNEATDIISKHQDLNQTFVKEEVFSQENLNKLGLAIKEGKLFTKNSNEDTIKILNDLVEKIQNKVITTRKNRGKSYEVLEPENQKIITNNISNELKEFKEKTNDKIIENKPQKRQSSRTKKKYQPIFGGILFLKHGDISDLYRDITELYQFYCDKKDKLSHGFPVIIRMALRLIVETAAKEESIPLNKYTKKYFALAKENLSKDEKTTLSTQNVTEGSIDQLLQIGAHQYTAAKNLDQLLAMSIIIGKILEKSHGKS